MTEKIVLNSVSYLHETFSFAFYIFIEIHKTVIIACEAAKFFCTHKSITYSGEHCSRLSVITKKSFTICELFRMIDNLVRLTKESLSLMSWEQDFLN
jgi:hypothetical protein